jgi:hypothetical protein
VTLRNSPEILMIPQEGQRSVPAALFLVHNPPWH